MVRLSTQNLLACPSNQCSYPSNYPLSFRNVSKVEIAESEPNEAFLRNFVAKVDYAALRKSAKELGNEDLSEMSPDLTNPDSIDEQTLKALHHVLLEIQVLEGELVCPSCSHIFRIKDGIANMLLAEHEIRK